MGEQISDEKIQQQQTPETMTGSNMMGPKLSMSEKEKK